MKYFYQQNKEIESFELSLNSRIKSFLDFLRVNPEFNKEILSFGIIGPTGRKEGFFINKNIRSDVDFYVLSKSLNLFKEKKFKKLFYQYFPKKDDFSAHYISPSIFEKPDLMFFEYTNSGKVLFGKNFPPCSLERISKFECFRNVIFRGCYFLNLLDLNSKSKFKSSISNDEIIYAYSKIIFALGEIILILENKYVASNFKRNSLIKKLNLTGFLKDFKKEHQKMHDFRYKSVLINYSKKDLFSNATKYLNLTYKLLNKDLINNFDLKKVHPDGFFKTTISRLLFLFDYFKLTKNLPISLITEPFISLTFMMQNFVSGKSFSDKNLKKILIYWKIAPWFYYKIS